MAGSRAIEIAPAINRTMVASRGHDTTRRSKQYFARHSRSPFHLNIQPRNSIDTTLYARTSPCRIIDPLLSFAATHNKRYIIVYFVLSDRNGLIRPVPKNAVWAEVGVYKGDFSQIVLDTCGPSR